MMRIIGAWMRGSGLRRVIAGSRSSRHGGRSRLYEHVTRSIAGEETRLPQPLALLEVGAAAGLCLLPDRYAYDYGEGRIAPSEPITREPPLFRCRAGRGVPIPQRNVEVAWRAGLDLQPIDLNDE
jgi:hypothetical protein